MTNMLKTLYPDQIRCDDANPHVFRVLNLVNTHIMSWFTDISENQPTDYHKMVLRKWRWLRDDTRRICMSDMSDFDKYAYILKAVVKFTKDAELPDMAEKLSELVRSVDNEIEQQVYKEEFEHTDVPLKMRMSLGPA